VYFDLTDDQKAIADTIRSALRDAYPEDKAVAKFTAAELDRELWAQLSEMGLGGVLVPEDKGGIGMDLLTLAAIEEELGYFAAAVPVASNAVAAWLIAQAGSEAQRERWVGPLIAGEAIAAFALQEDGRIDPVGWTLDVANLQGTKPNVLFGGDASLFIVGTQGGGLALVEADAAGVEVKTVRPTDGSQPLSHLALDGATGEPLAADAALVTRLLDALYVLAAADACGAGNHSVDLAVGYAKMRKQFDRLIGSFQGLKHQLANMKAEMEPVRSLVWYAAHCWDAIPEKASYTASLAKAHASEIAVKVSRAAVEAHGGIGYTWEYPLHIYLKRAMTARAANGLPACHRERSAKLAGW
jgi:alkylation response protein AidB-like acyl-CoA dehydrogenase